MHGHVRWCMLQAADDTGCNATGCVCCPAGNHAVIMQGGTCKRHVLLGKLCGACTHLHVAAKFRLSLSSTGSLSLSSGSHCHTKLQRSW